jgi:uncharacterized membrane protein
MDLLILIVALVAIGFVVWLLTTKVPMPPNWAIAIQVLALVIIVIYLISRFLPLPNMLPR